MNNRIITITVCLLLTMAVQAQVSDAARRIHEKLQAFVASGEYNVSGGEIKNLDEVTGSKTTVYGFSQIFGIENSNDSTILFQHLKELNETLRCEAFNAKEAYIHDASEGAPLMKGVNITYGGKNGKVSSQLPFNSQQNVRIVSVEEPDGYRYAVILLWEQHVKYDEQIKENHWMMNGTLLEIYGKKRETEPFMQPIIQLTMTMKPAPDPATPQTYEELLSKVKQTCHIYQRETSGGKTAAVVILHKMCEGYPHKLTREQYNTLIAILSPFAETAAGQKHKDMFGYSCYTLYKKSEHYQEVDSAVKRPAMITSSSITTEQLRKYVRYNSLIVNESEDLQQVNCQISGIAKNADSITVCRGVASFEELGKYPVKNGRFAFTCQLPKDEVCKLTTDKRYFTYFWADGQPVDADLTQRTVKSSKDSQQRNNFLNEMETERLHMLQIGDRAELDAAIKKQRERYRQVIFTGKDELLKAYALYKIYTELTYEELKPFVGKKFRYASHLLMTPVKEYVAGLEKRRPGTRYKDMLLMDAQGGYHQLSDYVGKGYVILHFRESWNRGRYNILPQLRTLYSKYHAKDGLQIVTLAMDKGDNCVSRLKEEQLPWPHLMTMAAQQTYGILSWPEIIVIAPDGTIMACPQTVEELDQVLKNQIYPSH